MENKFENLTQKVQVMEDTLHVVVREISSEYAKINDYLEGHKQQKEQELQLIRDLIRVHDENREALTQAQSLNKSHYEAQDYIKRQTEVLKKALQTVYTAFYERIEYLDQRIGSIPKTFTVENHHHVEPKSKGMLVIFIVLLFTSVLGLSWGTVNYFEKQMLDAGNVKYRMFRQQFPEMNQRIDSIFYKDPERAKMIISKLEAETELRKAAELKRREAEQVGREAEKLQREDRSVF